MKVIAIFGDLVEVSIDGEIVYLSIEDFIEQYGEEALYGDEYEVEECEEGRMFKF